MTIGNSLLGTLLKELPHLKPQMYFKSSLIALSHAMEDLILSGNDSPLVIANFQKEGYFLQEINRYIDIAKRTNQVYILAAPETEPGFTQASASLETVALNLTDTLVNEWHLIIVGKEYSTCLVCKEKSQNQAAMDSARLFEGIWTFEKGVSKIAARWLLKRIVVYRPELAPKVEEAKKIYGLTSKTLSIDSRDTTGIDAAIFARRLVFYLQKGEYKLLKAYDAIAASEKKERLIYSLTTAIRKSLNPQEVLTVAVQELGQIFAHCRCLVYRLNEPEGIKYEVIPSGMKSLENWSLTDSPLWVAINTTDRAIAINDVSQNPYLQGNAVFRAQIKQASIRSWLVVPIRHQGNLLGIIELHHGGKEALTWQKNDLDLVEAIATQLGIALTQSQAYTNLAILNRKLEELESTQSNLIAIVGHELRTPLSTIQVCLESLATEPEMAREYRQGMLDIALTDAGRMRRLIQDFLTLSKLESGQAHLRLEPLQLLEVFDLALSSLKKTKEDKLPEIKVNLPPNLPLVRGDGEGLVQVVIQILDNACKFSDADGQIIVKAQIVNDFLEVIISDTGRGIESSGLEAIFDRFYQEEDWLQRTVGGTGLGLAICRQLIEAMGGKIWATSGGKNQGSEFHFTIPIDGS